MFLSKAVKHQEWGQAGNDEPCKCIGIKENLQ